MLSGLIFQLHLNVSGFTGKGSYVGVKQMLVIYKLKLLKLI